VFPAIYRKAAEPHTGKKVYSAPEIRGFALMDGNTLTLTNGRAEAIGAPELAAQPNSWDAMPTVEAYGLFQNSFSFLNQRLFGGLLPDCMITFSTNRRALGYFCAGAFENRERNVAHEISMNPRYLGVRPDAESFSTFVHEMSHLARHVSGRLNRKGGKGRGGYHDRVWADIMESVGLMPSTTGAPGGKRTGYAVHHYIIKGGPFELACQELLGSGHFIDWRSARPLYTGGPSGGEEPAPPPRNTRTCFVCAGCDVKAWSRRTAKLSCNDCSKPLVAR